jgi:hypothetical protein
MQGAVYIHDLSGNVLNINTSGMINATISGSATSVSGNVLRNQIFDASGVSWVNSSVTYSGSPAIAVSEWGEPTYVINADNVAILPGGSGHQFVVMHTSGAPIVKLKTLYIVPTPENANVSGSAVKYDILRITNTSGGGTAQSGIPLDPQDPACVPLTIQTRVTSGCAGVIPMGSWITTSQNLPTTTNTLPLSGTPGVGYDFVNMAQTTNILNRTEVETRDIMLRSGYGFSVRQSTGSAYTPVPSGSFNFIMTFTQV